MRKDAFWDVFLSFSRKERQKFIQFLESPYHNKRAELPQLARLLDERIELKLEFPERIDLYTKLFNSNNFDDQRLRHTLSYFNQSLLSFLALEELERNPAQKLVYQARALRKRGLQEHFSSHWKKTVKVMSNSPFRDRWYHFHRFQLLEEDYEHSHRSKRQGYANLQEQVDELTVFFLSSILRQACIIQSYQRINERHYDQRLLIQAIQSVENGQFLNIPAVSVYYYSYKTLQGKDPQKAFAQLKSLIDTYWHQFRTEEIRDIYLFAINFCIRQINNGIRNFMREAFDLYKSGLENKCLLDNNLISPFAFKNIMLSAISLKEYSWAENFIQNYKKFLPPSVRENTFNYNLAILHYNRKDYDRAMELLQMVDLKDTLNNLDARRMLLKIYYEINAYNALESHVDSFRLYLSRHKSLGYHRQSYALLIKFVKKLIYANRHDKNQINKLKIEIKSSPDFAEKHWLLEQLS